MAFAGDRVELLQPLVVPVLGGEVALQSLAMRGVLVADAGVEWQAGVWLREVDLEQLTELLDWPRSVVRSAAGWMTCVTPIVRSASVAACSCRPSMGISG